MLDMPLLQTFSLKKGIPSLHPLLPYTDVHVTHAMILNPVIMNTSWLHRDYFAKISFWIQAKLKV